MKEKTKKILKGIFFFLSWIVDAVRAIKKREKMRKREIPVGLFEDQPLSVRTQSVLLRVLKDLCFDLNCDIVEMKKRISELKNIINQLENETQKTQK